MTHINQALLEKPIRYVPEWRHDPYQIRRKWPDPCVCPDCGAIYSSGRWCWPICQLDAERRLCPACQRIRECYPAGYLTLRGTFLPQHRNEIEALISTVIDRQSVEHPLKRLMGSVKYADGSQVITFTEPYLASLIGERMVQSYAGILETEYSEGDYLVRVEWTRNV
jgi:hypothetical protein